MDTPKKIIIIWSACLHALKTFFECKKLFCKKMQDHDQEQKVLVPKQM